MRKAWVPGVYVLVVVSLATPLALRLGVGEVAQKARRDFVALRYLSDASRAVGERPANRALARERLARALALAPNEPVILETAPSIYVAAGDYAAADRALARQADPSPLLRGQVWLMMGKREAGAQVLMAVVRGVQDAFRAKTVSESEYALQLNNVGYTLADAGELLTEARGMLEIANNLLPLEPSFVDSLGWACYRQGDYREASFYLERAARLQPSPGDAVIYYHLGATYARLGRPRPARHALMRSLRLDPQNPDTQRELDALRWVLPPPVTA